MAKKPANLPIALFLLEKEKWLRVSPEKEKIE